MASAPEPDALSSNSSFSGTATDASSNIASLDSTPPTTVSPDSISLASEPEAPQKPDTDAPEHALEEPVFSSPLLAGLIPLLEKTSTPRKGDEMQNETRETHVIAVTAEVSATVGTVETIIETAAAPAAAAAPKEPDNQAIQPREADKAASDAKDAKEGEDKHGPQTIVVVAEEPKQPQAQAPETPTPSRPRRARASLPVYNLVELSGTAMHRKRGKNGDVAGEKRPLSTEEPGNNNTDNNDSNKTNADSTDSAKNTSTATAGQLAQDGGIEPPSKMDTRSAGEQPSTPKGAKEPKKKTNVKSDKQATTHRPTPASAPAAARRPTRLSGVPTETLATKISALGKRGRKAFEKGISHMTRELRRLQDTDEFAHIDHQPIRYTVWSKGKYVDPVEEAERAAREEAMREEEKAGEEEGGQNDDGAEGGEEKERDADLSPPRKKLKTTADTAADAEKKKSKKKDGEPSAEPADAPPAPKKRRVKKWLDKGLYAGQEAPADFSKVLTAAERKKLADCRELSGPIRENKAFPMPMFNGLRMLINGRDFKLPFDVCNPLPPGQPKPTAWRTMAKNRFVGDAAAYWKKTPVVEDFASRCVCKAVDGCGEDCQNRIMLYECDDSNCNVGRTHCTNRAFQDLQERTKKGGRYRVGVEVYKTVDRGYGVRSNRCFEPNQIIMEYTGEIITEEECERRMNEVYKDNECYYLMSFDQNMIIDATTGSIARFVNHSCLPNCRMIKWIVAGQPRMALFAGDRPIMTGEELTYDYNFDPFSAKNVQKCLCGSANCRGVLGPKPREVKPPKPPKEDKTSAAGGGKKPTAVKRKLKDLLAGSSSSSGDGAKVVKKRKTIATAKGVATKAKLSSAGKAVAKGAAAVLKKGMASISVKAKPTATSKVKAKTPVKAEAKANAKTVTKKVTVTTKVKKTKEAVGAAVGAATFRRTKTTSVLRTYGKGSTQKATAAVKVLATKTGAGSPSANLTIVAAGMNDDNDNVAVPGTPKTSTPKTSTPKTSTPKAKKTTTAAALTAEMASPTRKRTPSRKLLESGGLSPIAPKQGGGSGDGGAIGSKKGSKLARTAHIRVVKAS